MKNYRIQTVSGHTNMNTTTSTARNGDKDAFHRSISSGTKKLTSKVFKWAQNNEPAQIIIPVTIPEIPTQHLILQIMVMVLRQHP